jgi:hypothetical protein
VTEIFSKYFHKMARTRHQKKIKINHSTDLQVQAHIQAWFCGLGFRVISHCSMQNRRCKMPMSNLSGRLGWTWMDEVWFISAFFQATIEIARGRNPKMRFYGKQFSTVDVKSTVQNSHPWGYKYQGANPKTRIICRDGGEEEGRPAIAHSEEGRVWSSCAIARSIVPSQPCRSL